MGATLLLAWAGGRPAAAIYALSFWHYYLYWLAYRHGSVPLPVFKRDAVTMKTAALAALGIAYFAAPLDGLSLAVTAAGFLLNAAGAMALGSDRTYYGYELGALAPQRVTRFPFSVVPHPMLLGNMAAYGGTLLNPEFRVQWWPLACAHIALNLGLLVMELRVTPLRLATPEGPAGVPRPFPWRPALAFAAAGAAVAAAAGWAAGIPRLLPASGLGACIVMFACVLHWYYSAPSARPLTPGSIQPEQSHD